MGYFFISEDDEKASENQILTSYGRRGVGVQICKCSWGKGLVDGQDMRLLVEDMRTRGACYEI